MEKQYYYAYSKYLKEKYGEKVYKLPVNLPVTCPNRKEGGGCLFCADAGTGFEAKESTVPVLEQLQSSREKVEKRYHAHKCYCVFSKLYKYVFAAACLASIYGRGRWNGEYR